MKDWFNEYYEWRARAEKAERLLQDGLPPKEIGRAHHIKDLEVKVSNLQRQVTHMREALEDRNRQLRAMKLIVYCSGGCTGGVPDLEYITEEVVAEAERNTKRLRTWWENRKYRLEQTARLPEGN